MFLRFRVCLALFGLLLGFALLESRVVWARNVSYDGRALIIDGHHRILFSGAIHYPRSPPQMWPSLISKARAGGLEVIETYVFWNLHEPRPGKYNFRGGRNIVRFIKEIQAQGLYACLRIGPFIEAEWTYGGLPFWLHDVPGIVFRSDNEPFKHYMKRFVKKIVKMMKAEKLYASQGGPIILSQIENEYGMVEAAFKQKGPVYVKWAAKMAVKLNTGVPWVMCKQNDAPDPVINACNGRKCGETFAGPNSPNKPAIWTENWTSFLQAYGEEPPIRSAEDIAFQVALFIAKNGSFINYYMYHGGTNLGRTGAAYMLTSYYDQAPLDEYGLLREPKWGHLKELHAAIKLCLKPLLSGVYFTESLGESQEAFVYRGATVNNCAAFLVNNDTRKNVTVHFQDSLYDLPPKSISILPNCKTVAFNTAQVGTQYSTRGVETSIKLDSVDKWKVFSEAVPTYAHTSLRAKMLLEHMNTTKDKSDYLWYTFRFMHDTSGQFVLDVSSFGHVVHAFVNGAFVGSAHGSRNNKSVNLQQVVSLNKGRNHVSLLSVMVGLPDSGAFLERRVAGLTGVRIQSESESRDFTNHSWGYQVGLLGEKRKIYTKHGAAKVNWRRYGSSTLKPLTWYKTLFDAPAGKDPVALNMESMGKGEVWVNGHSIGRYWVSFHTQKGTPSQTWYNIPRAYLKHSNNRLVILEEEKAYPLGVSVDTISITRVCGRVLDSYLPPVVSWHRQSWKQHEHGHQAQSHKPKVQLHCPQGKHISTILFASYGTPVGDCQSYAIGSCHSPNSLTVVEKACLGKQGCSIHLRSWKFGGDPCPGTPKTLLVDARCSLLLSN